MKACRKYDMLYVGHAAAELKFISDMSANLKRLLKKKVQIMRKPLTNRSSLVCVFNLSLNLCLSSNCAIDSCRDLHQMGKAILTEVGIEFVLKVNVHFASEYP
jgi:hypothetical protein